jgi:hypothetical protein
MDQLRMPNGVRLQIQLAIQFGARMWQFGSWSLPCHSFVYMDRIYRFSARGRKYQQLFSIKF